MLKRAPSPASGRIAVHGYRPDIDGLRAVAVAAVVLYHYRIPGFSGGFVGVDVFFVISGFLITSLVLGEREAGRFSLIRFYERRVRRIFPALFVMLAGAAGAAALILFPEDFHRFARSLLATSLFASNIEFLREVSYFQPAALQRPLLHLWSIAVEEQFYLLFPALLLLTPRRRTALLVGALMVASFGFSQWAVGSAPGWAFYMLPSRMWELMGGALLALVPFGPPQSGPVRDLMALLGLGLIGFAIVTFAAHTPFPGAHALYPCLGAMLIIWTGAGGGRVCRVLSLRPLVGLGLVSYSLYLWHWPIYVFAHYALYRSLTPAEVAGCLAASLALAILSWRFVEQPFRRPRSGQARPARWVFGAGALAVLVTLAGASTILASNGFPGRFDPAIRTTLAEARDNDGLLATCFGLPLGDINGRRLCRFGAGRNLPPSFLLWGDSHADAILPAVRAVAERAGREGWFAGQPSCAPLLGVSRPDAPHCKAFNDRVIAFVRTHPQIRTVILEARWAKNADGRAYGDEGHGFVPIADAVARARKPADNGAIFTRGLVRTVAALRKAHRKVVLMGPVPEIGWAVPIVLARLELAGDPPWRGPSLAQYRKRQRIVLPLFARLAKERGVRAIFPDRYFCRSGRCEVQEDGRPLYRDEHHLSVFGAMKLVPLLSPLFSAPAPSPPS